MLDHFGNHPDDALVRQKLQVSTSAFPAEKLAVNSILHMQSSVKREYVQMLCPVFTET